MWTVPNILTLARLTVLPWVVYLMWPGVETHASCFWAAVIYAIAGITDLVDGALARKLGQVTVMGKFLDPLSDKLFYLVAMVALLQIDGTRIPFWVVVAVLVRELSITGLRAIAAGEGIVIAAGEGGKVKTAFANIGMVCLIAHYTYIVDFGFLVAPVSLHTVGLWVTYLSVAFAWTSGIGYVRGFLKALALRDAAKVAAAHTP